MARGKPWYHVLPVKEGKYGDANENFVGWAIYKTGADKASKIVETKADAITEAQDLARNNGNPGVVIRKMGGSLQGRWENQRARTGKKPSKGYKYYANGDAVRIRNRRR